MDAYFDKEGLLSMIRSSRSAYFEDCLRMIKDNIILHILFPKEAIDKFEDDDKNDINMWLRRMDNLQEEIHWNDSSLVSAPKKRLLQSLYFLDSKFTSKLREENALLIAERGEEISLLSTLFVEGNQFTDNVFNKINQWDDLEQFASPCTDIIIVDSYILSSPDMYESNLYRIISILSKKDIKQNLNIVIFTPKTIYDRKNKIEFEPDWEDIYKKIKKLFHKKYPPKVTFVTMSEKSYKEHDRTIMTNYKSFASGDSYNYFVSSGQRVTKGRYLHVHSLVKKSNLEDMDAMIKDLQECIDGLKKINPSLIMKDQECNFLSLK